ncbi:MAG: ATP-binding protein [Armatimonadetes bacterium]|nr:ATP-binding protein [Armatimonadota bacterium]
MSNVDMIQDLSGRLKKLHIPRNKPLIPLFEAIANSYQATASSNRTIEVYVKRDPSLTNPQGEGLISSVTIKDRGVGFNEVNMTSFSTADSRHKEKIGGKGVGRFTWLKTFDRVKVASVYENNGQFLKREFEFSTEGGIHEIDNSACDESESGTTINLIGYKEPYRNEAPTTGDEVAESIVQHCLLILADDGGPEILLHDGGLYPLKEYFRDYCSDRTRIVEFTVSGQTLKLTILRVYSGGKIDHRLYYAASKREVCSDLLKTYLLDLAQPLADEGGCSFYINAYVEGDILTESVDGDRSTFFLPKTIAESADQSSFFENVSLEEIRIECLKRIRSEFSSFFDSIKERKLAKVDAFRQKDPKYYVLESEREAIVDLLPPSPSRAKLEEVHADALHRLRKDTAKASRRLVKAMESDNAESFSDQAKVLLEKLSGLNVSALAQYIMQRRVILDFLRNALKKDDNEKFSREDVIHKLIFPMKSEGSEVDFDDHNLWLIDDRLAFHLFLASDKPIGKMSYVESQSKNRPDIFEISLAYGDDESRPTGLTLVELKRPGRESYDEDPITQTLRHLDDIRESGLKNRHGRPIRRAAELPAFIFIICDLNSDVIKAAKRSNLMECPDGDGFFGYIGPYNAYVEVRPFGRMLDLAIQRNKAFFDRLGLHTN